MDNLIFWIAGALINGAVTWGVVKTTLHFLTEGVREAKQEAALAHDKANKAHNRIARIEGALRVRA